MRAIAYSETGPSSVLQLVDRDIPQPGPGEVRVRIVVSGVNPTDWKARAGARAGRPAPFPEVVPNQDGAGVVDAVGDGVTGVAVGDRVWMFLAAHGRPTGTAQEFTVVPESRVVKLPDAAGFELGASLGVPAMTAHRALTVHEVGPTRLGPGALEGRTVLVAGGAGAVGHAAIQLARWAGAQVITTISSPEKAALATAAGAHHVVNYRADDAARAIRAVAPDGVDQVVEVSPARNAALNAKVIANHGSVSVYATDGGAEMTLDVRHHFSLNARYQFLLLYTVGDAALAAAADDVTRAVDDGALPVGEEAGLPLTRFPLERTAEAHDAVEAGTVGKVLIDVGSEAADITG
ncbi:NADPH2:quinone reductase [Agromyces flavus]|uniref:NADPH2:quinone reductase n=1 Tax=Agromyces flavus TaxID=589382 RepID=A0A1H1W8L0_9MICO|nr:NADPH:quinone reductase [Agromyces flavus]MCP2366111.1 NADPH2:quinone reductase [Agromyces flavus]GGI44022.1 NADPH:quinone reductase [Agromyces flavus]SDS93443.1 NADPH2:quinone reductase [Agromyces flavus]